MRQVYMSFPMYRADDDFEAVKRKAITSDKSIILKYHERGTSDYYHLINGCNELVFTTLDNKFSGLVDDLPTGVRKEVKYACRNGFKFWLAYRTTDGAMNIYEASCDGITFSGHGGTPNKYFKYEGNNLVTKNESIQEDVLPSKSNSDTRLNLLSDVRVGAFF